MTAFKRVDGGWESHGWRIQRLDDQGRDVFLVFEPSGRCHGAHADLNAAMMRVVERMEAAEKPVEPLPAMSEKELQTRVKALAEANGWKVYHTYDSRKSDPGFPDLVLVRGEHVYFWELKTQSGKVTKEQAEWIDALGEAVWWSASVRRPSDWPDIVEVLTAPSSSAPGRASERATV